MNTGVKISLLSFNAGFIPGSAESLHAFHRRKPTGMPDHNGWLIQEKFKCTWSVVPKITKEKAKRQSHRRYTLSIRGNV